MTHKKKQFSRHCNLLLNCAFQHFFDGPRMVTYNGILRSEIPCFLPLAMLQVNQQ